MTEKLPKIYVSAAMRGIPEENRLLFDSWAEWLRQAGAIVRNPHEITDELLRDEKIAACDDDMKIKVFLATDMAEISACDLVLVLNHHDLNTSRGVCAEAAFALAADIPVYSILRENTETHILGIAGGQNNQTMFESIILETLENADDDYVAELVTWHLCRRMGIPLPYDPEGRWSVPSHLSALQSPHPTQSLRKEKTQ